MSEKVLHVAYRTGRLANTSGVGVLLQLQKLDSRRYTSIDHTDHLIDNLTVLFSTGTAAVAY